MVWILIILFIIISLYFHKNIFMELAFGTRLLLIVISVAILGTAYATEKTPSPFEIRFYEDYMVVYREKYYYDRDLSRKEYDKFFYKDIEASVYKGYKQDKIEMRGDRAEMSDFPLYLNTVAGGLDRRDQTIGGFSFVVKIYAVPVVEIIG